MRATIVACGVASVGEGNCAPRGISRGCSRAHLQSRRGLVLGGHISLVTQLELKGVGLAAHAEETRHGDRPRDSPLAANRTVSNPKGEGGRGRGGAFAGKHRSPVRFKPRLEVERQRRPFCRTRCPVASPGVGRVFASLFFHADRRASLPHPDGLAGRAQSRSVPTRGWRPNYFVSSCDLFREGDCFSFLARRV